MENSSLGPPSVREVFANRGFLIYWLTTVVSQAGSFMQAITIPFLLHDLTGSNTWLGAGALAGILPAVVLSPIAGSLSDRVSRKGLLLFSNVVQLAAAAALWSLAVTDNLAPWPIIGLLALGGVGAGFQYTVQLALVPLLVPTRHLVRASRINSVTVPAARSFGPAIAGLILNAKGPTWTVGINALSFLVVLWGLLVIRPRTAPKGATASGIVEHLRGGFQYARRHGLLVAMFAAFVSALLGGPLLSLTAGLVAEDFERGPDMIGRLIACQGVGALVSSYWLVTRADRYRRSVTVRLGFVVYAAAVMGAVITVEPTIASIGYALAGAGHVLVGSSIITILQIQVRDEFRGRVMGLQLMALQTGVPIGAVFGGIMGDVVGLRPVLGAYAIAMLVFVGVAHIRFDGFRRFDVDPNQPVAPSVRGGPVS